MALPSGLAWRDMETRGFLHVPGFLTPAQLQACLSDYGGAPRSINGNFDVPGAGEGISVLKEALHDVWIPEVRRVQHLDRHIAIEIRVPRDEDKAERTLAQLLAELVLADPTPW